ncbi:hypothetical protein HYG86_09090 [Alkalicella caledoniensis]|uniref:Uncharacterized protein n=1 Tax=Alkalicella caledoniensis TaxID=2731377 RepID=A0A7G9W8A4_ALKCA|nr:hypothetical protein [Alkalicella caledoniensis]QNO14916.1 hypothetical protein HYG86_09090 [Alkalicella caledoniensis]
MIEIRLGELKGILEGLQVLIEKEIPIKVSYRISKMVKKVVEEYNLFEESRQKLLEKHGEKDEKGQLISKEGMVVFKDAEEFHKEFHSLSNTDIELDIKSLKLDDLGNITLSPKTLLALDKVIKE